MDLAREQEVQRIGREILTASADHSVSLFDKNFWSGKMMEWSMQFPAFKIEMFRFVDVLPSLVHTKQIVEHIREYFLRDDLDVPSFVKAGIGMATSNALTSGIAAATIKKNVEAMATTFITGSNSKTAAGTLEKLWNSGQCFTVDILGEAALSESEALSYQKRYLELVEGLPSFVAPWKANAKLETNSRGVVPRANVSVKCSSLYSQMDNLAFRESVDAIKGRLRPILQAAVARQVFVNLDMEQNDWREMFLTVAMELFMEPEFVGYPHFGIVIQAYLKCAEEDLKRVAAWAKARGAPITVRLVKGAYWDYEVIQSLQRAWPIPVWTYKAQTDANYERCADLMLQSFPHVLSAFGSHNVRNLGFCMARAKELGLSNSDFEIQMLFGMAEPFKRALVAKGLRVRDYAPVGELLPGMAYLVRRLLENTSNEGFLKSTFVDQAEVASLLANPASKVQENVTQKVLQKGDQTVFQNEAFLDFSLESNRSRWNEAMSKVRGQLPIEVRPVVNGKIFEDGLAQMDVSNPSQLKERVSSLRLASQPVAELAVSACKKAMSTWAKRSPEERVSVLRKAANLMQERRYTLSALMVLEVAKSPKEADADVCEAIDFCNYYAKEYERFIQAKDMGSTPGESNRFSYQARGTAVVIAPWNFPLAILCGMAVGPLVCGNPVILKPAEQASAIAQELYRLLLEAGVPSEALHFLPGLGEVVGDALVKHPDVHLINFTGSRAVGLQLLVEAARLRPGQRHIKKAICELGGKNAIVVDEDADLDEAVAGAIHSSFGFQGQKCSAASRLIVLDSCYDKFKNRFVEAMKSLKVGRAEDSSAKVGPVVDREARDRLLQVIERNRANIVAQLEVSKDLQESGNFVPPTVFESTDPKSELGQVEFFGPLVTLFRAPNMDTAIQWMNDVDYALTGGIFSRSPKNIERARVECEVGNLYINRGITGALVFRQPFGGFKLSGVGAKAGGPDYLLQFLEPRSVTENTMRRGFAPEIS